VNYGADIGLPPEEQPKVAHLKVVAIHPDYNGDGLQRKINEAQIELMRSAGFRHTCCTIFPKNPYSLRNFTADGLVIKGPVAESDGRTGYNAQRPHSVQGFATDSICISVSQTQISKAG